MIITIIDQLRESLTSISTMPIWDQVDYFLVTLFIILTGHCVLRAIVCSIWHIFRYLFKANMTNSVCMEKLDIMNRKLDISTKYLNGFIKDLRRDINNLECRLLLKEASIYPEEHTQPSATASEVVDVNSKTNDNTD